MSKLIRQLWLLTILGVVVAGCKPIESLLERDEASEIEGNPEIEGEEPTSGDENPELPPPPAPPPAEEPPPDPEEGVVSVRVKSTTLVLAEGATGDLDVWLSEKPSADMTVTVDFKGNDGSIELVGTDTLTFTPANWDTAQAFTFHAAQDDDAVDGVAAIDLDLDGDRSISVFVVSTDDEVEVNDGVRLTVREGSDYGATDYPVLAVIPLEYGKFHDTSTFRIRDGADNPIPAQFSVLNRWTARDNSIRHVVARFKSTVVPQGTTDVYFKTDGGDDAGPAQAVSVDENGNVITVNTGPLRFSILKEGFNLFHEVHFDGNRDGNFSSSEQIVAPGTSEGPVFSGRLAGDVQRAKDRDNIEVVVEERGPVRAVIRIGSLGQFTSRDDHDHGFAIRIYAYAGSGAVKVAYQLQNSAINTMYSAPLYFEDFSLNVKTAFDSPTVRFGLDAGKVWHGGKGNYLYQSSLDRATVHSAGGSGLVSAVKPAEDKGDSMYGWADVFQGEVGMAVAIRHMAEMWPNGIDVEADCNVAVRLWPKWGAQRYNYEQSPTGLYWLDDMQHVLKEALFVFHGPEMQEDGFERAAANFQYHPVVNVPIAEYRRTQVTFEMGGHVPPEALMRIGTPYRYQKHSDYQLDETNSKYNFGWKDFGGNVWRKKANQAGGEPSSLAEYFVTGGIRDYFIAERRMLGDLNCRPIWLAGYDNERDFDRIRPTERPHGSRSWRNYVSGVPYLAEPYLDGTGYSGWYPRDHDHGWFYHVENFYLMSADLFVKDWYDWLAEFRKRSFFRNIDTGDGVQYWEWGWGTRAEGHAFASAVAAYRVTGDPQLLEAIKNRIHFHRFAKDGGTKPGISRDWGCMKPYDGEACFQLGFVSRALCNVLSELEGYHPLAEARAFLTLWGTQDWNYHISRYAYYTRVDGDRYESSGTSLTMPDAAAWFYLKTGLTKHMDLAKSYLAGELGKDPYGDWGKWDGSWENRTYRTMLIPKANTTAAAAITNLSAQDAAGKVRLTWTTPANASRFLVVWSDKPISRTYTQDLSKRNVWGCVAVGTDLKAESGKTQSLEFGGVPAGKRLYCAVLTFTADDNLSECSNIAVVDMP